MKRDAITRALLGFVLTALPFFAQANHTAGEARHRDTIVRVAKENRIDPALLMAVVKVESNFDAYARNPDGPVGLTQITPVTARSVQPGIRHADLVHPERNLQVGARHLRDLLDQFRDPRMAIAAYQAGVGRVKATGPGILKDPHTGRHVSKVMTEYETYRKVLQPHSGKATNGKAASATATAATKASAKTVSRGGRYAAGARQPARNQAGNRAPARR